MAPILAAALAATLLLASTAAPAGASAAAAQPDSYENIARYHQLAADLSVTIAQTQIMQRQIETLQERIAQRRAVVGRVAAASYRNHRLDPVYVLSDAETTEEAVDRLLLITAFTVRQRDEIRKLQHESARYDAARRTLDSLILQQRRQQQDLMALRLKLQPPRP